MTLAYLRRLAQPISGDEPGRPGFRPDIEGLRGVAVLLVVLYHAQAPGFSGGFVGVDVFFVLSGYLITGLLVAEVEGTGRLDLVRFYARRARRLLPAAFLVLVATLLASRLLLLPEEQETVGRAISAASVYLSNVWFARQSTDYFAADTLPSPVLHTWSLAVEEQFYLVWPVLVLLGMRGLKGTPRRRPLIVLMGGVAAVSLAASVLMTATEPARAFFSAPTAAWTFALGGIAGLLPPVLAGRWSLPARALGWAGLAAVLAASATFSHLTTYPGVAKLVPVAGTLAVLVGCAASAGGAGRLLRLPPLQWLGRVSYSWYLWHWPVLVLASAVWGRLHPATTAACVLLSLGLAAATYALVENPVRHLPYLTARPGRSIALAGLLPILGVGLAQWGRWSAMAEVPTTRQLAMTSAAAEWQQTHDPDCHLDFEAVRVPTCESGHTDSPTTVVLFGDSHAMHWRAALEQVARERGWKLVSLTKSACPAPKVRLVHPAHKRRYLECEKWRRAAIARIQALQPAAVVMASSSGYVRDRWTTPRKWRLGTRRTLDAFAREGIPTLLVRDVPRPGFDVPSCLGRSARRQGDPERACTYPLAKALDHRAFRGERLAARRAGLAEVVDLTAEICDTRVCSPVRDGLVTFADDDHLAVRFSEALSPQLARRLDPLVDRRGGAAGDAPAEEAPVASPDDPPAAL